MLLELLSAMDESHDLKAGWQNLSVQLFVPIPSTCRNLVLHLLPGGASIRLMTIVTQALCLQLLIFFSVVQIPALAFQHDEVLAAHQHDVQQQVQQRVLQGLNGHEHVHEATALHHGLMRLAIGADLLTSRWWVDWCHQHQQLLDLQGSTILVGNVTPNGTDTVNVHS